MRDEGGAYEESNFAERRVPKGSVAAMSAMGHKRRLRRVHSMSALPPKPDIRGGSDYVRAVRLAAWRYSLRLIGVGAFAARGCKAC